MTIGGNVLENNANVVELTSLNSLTSSVPPCLQNLSPFPMNVQFAAAGLLSRTWTKKNQLHVDIKCVSKVLAQLSDSRTSYFASVTISASANNFLS